MLPIPTTDIERKLLDARNRALHETKEYTTFQATVDTIVILRGLSGPHTLSSDFTQIIPQSTMADLNLPPGVE